MSTYPKGAYSANPPRCRHCRGTAADWLVDPQRPGLRWAVRAPKGINIEPGQAFSCDCCSQRRAAGLAYLTIYGNESTTFTHNDDRSRQYAKGQATPKLRQAC